MTRTKSEEKQGKSIKSHSSSTRKRKRREVEVISCPSAFPISSKPKGTSPQNSSSLNNPQQLEQEQQGRDKARNHNNQRLLDWNETAKEIRSLGATAFVGQQKRNFQDEEYEKLTGRKKKKHQVPLPIVRGIKKKAAERLARQIQEAKESGTVLPKSLTSKKNKDNKKGDNAAYVHGPAPSVGFMKKGVLKVQRPA